MASEEKERFESWLDEAPANRALYEEMRLIWDASEGYPAIQVHTDEALERFRGQVSAVKPARRPIRLWRFAAAAVAIVAVAAFGWLLLRPADQLLAEASTERVTVILHDQTQVTLNLGSSLNYPETFSGNYRIVELDGEAYFDVQRDTASPFIVRTSVGEIMVLGTAFNVEAEASAFTVYVTEGKVRLRPKGSDKSLDVLAGKAASFDRSTGILQFIKDASPNAISWKTDQLIFRDVPLSQVVQDLSAYFNMEIRIADPTMQACRFTSPLPFEAPSPADVFGVLQTIFEVESVTQPDGSYLLSGGTCR